MCEWGLTGLRANSVTKPISKDGKSGDIATTKNKGCREGRTEAGTFRRNNKQEERLAIESSGHYIVSTDADKSLANGNVPRAMIGEVLW